MRVIPAGEGTMGSPADEIGHREDERLHRAKVAAPFAMSQTEITLGQFGRFVEVAGYRTEADRESACLRVDDRGVELVTDLSLSWNSPGYPISDQNPVVCVTWNDASAYATWLSEQTGRTYRLPTEEEWEYAARGGTSTSRYWGEDPKDACYNGNTADETVLDAKGDSRRIEGARVPCRDGHLFTAPVGTYAANPWGLKDMIGNVAEWTCSVYDSGYGGAQGRCLDTGRRTGPAPMVLRGGSCLSSPDLARSAARDGLPSNLSLNTIGFRVVATEQPWVGALAKD
jgi:formylglycine-generating enzyme required for sulfatase activity